MDGFDQEGGGFGGRKKEDKRGQRRPYFVPDGPADDDTSTETGSRAAPGTFGNVGADDVTPFGIGSDIGTEKRAIKGMVATPGDIQDITEKGHGKKNIRPKDAQKPPYARYDPTDPFGGNPEPDPDHERPHR